MGSKPARPTATLTSPSRQGRPNVSAMMTAESEPGQLGEPAAQAARRARRSPPARGRRCPDPRWTGLRRHWRRSSRDASRRSARPWPGERYGASPEMTSTSRGSRPISSSERGGARRGADLDETDEPPLRLGHDLLAHHEQIAGGERRALGARGHDDQRGQIGARSELGQALDADHLVAGRHGAAISRRRGGRRCRAPDRGARRGHAPRGRGAGAGPRARRCRARGRSARAPAA